MRPGEESFLPFLGSAHVLRVVHVVVMLAAVGQFALHRRRLVWHPLVWAVMMMFGAIAASVPFAYWRGAAFDATEGFAKSVVVVLLLVNLVRTEKALRQIVFVTVACMVIVCVRVLLGYEGGRASGPSGSFGNSNELSALLTCMFPFALLLGLGDGSTSRPGRLFLLASCIPMLVVAVLTNSRAGAIGLLAAAIVLVLKSRRRALAVGLAVAVAAFAWVAMGPERQARLLSIQDRGEDASYIGRVHAWEAARTMFIEHPTFGVGAGSFSSVYGGEFVPPGRSRGLWMDPHNVYYQVLAELGLVGTTCFFLLVVLTFRTLRRARRACAPGHYGVIVPIAHAAEVALVVMLVTGWAGHNLYRFTYYFLAAVAVIAERLALAGSATPSRRQLAGAFARDSDGSTGTSI
jgi:O-antigen ligase